MKDGIKEILESRQCPGILGTRDSFGIGKEFRDERTNKTIDNWNSWERAGFKNPLEVVKNNNVKERMKEKIEKIKRTGNKKKLDNESLLL